jgi:hypothetical protein
MGQPQYNTFTTPFNPLEPIFSPFTNTNYRSAAGDLSCIIIAGTGCQEETFYAPKSALEKSTVIKGWIDDTESLPPSLRKDGALYFPECDPEVVRAVIKYLNSTTDGNTAILDPSVGGSRDVLFYVKTYKFALCLG